MASTSGSPEIDRARLLGWKEEVVGRLTGGLAQLAARRKVEVVRGRGRVRRSPRSRGRGRATVAAAR